MIKDKWLELPILIFFDTKTKVTLAKKICSEMKIDFYSAVTDQELETLKTVIKGKDRGVVATLAYYGRGTDIRFKDDSYVIIGFTPK